MSHKKRILLVITKAEIGGAQTHVADLIRGFSSHNEVHLAAGMPGPLMDEARAAGATVHLLPRLIRSINPMADVSSARECVELVRHIKPDIIHAHSSKAGIVGRIAGRLTRVPTVFTAHGWGFSPGVPRKRQLLALQVERAMSRFAQRIICVSKFDRQLALHHRVGNEELLRTVHSGIDSDSFDGPEIINPNQARRVSKPRFVMVARFSQQKHQITLLHALTQIEQDLHVDFVGSGPLLEECRELAVSLQVDSKVSFLGDRLDVPCLLQRAHGFVLSTHYEGLPISILEAMRARLPVIATNVGGISEEIEHERSGLLVPHGDSKAMADALRRLICSPEMREQLGEAGRQKLKREFTLERMIADTEAVYHEVWNGRKRTEPN